MEVLKIRSNNVKRYGVLIYIRSNQCFLDINFGKTTWMISFMGVLK